MSIVRLSGAEAVQIVQQIFQPSGRKGVNGWRPQSHRVYHGMLLACDGQPIDEVLPHAVPAFLCMPMFS